MLIEDVAKSLGDDIQFTYARPSDFNVMRDKRYPFITLDPLTSTPAYTVDDVRNYAKTWNASIAFYQLDSMASVQEEYSKLLDFTDDMVDKFVNKLNFYTDRSDSIIITGMSQTPFIRVMADCITGYVLTISIQALDDFNYCGLDC